MGFPNDVAQGAIVVGVLKPAPGGEKPYDAVRPPEGLAWGALPVAADGYVLTCSAGAAGGWGVAWVSPSSASLPTGAQNQVLATPTGSSGATALRAIVAADLPVVSVAKGGTDLSAAGTADQVLGVAHSGGGLEYKTLTAGANVTITPTAGTITIASTGAEAGARRAGRMARSNMMQTDRSADSRSSGDGTLNTTTGAFTITHD